MFTFLKFIIFRTNLLVLQRPKNVLFSRAEKKKKKSNEKAIKFKQACAGPRVWKGKYLNGKTCKF